MDITSVILGNDLLAWAEKAGAKFHRAGHEWRSTCPLHGGNNNQAFAVYHDAGKQKWKCFTHDCGGGDILDFVMKWQGCDKVTAYRMLGGEDAPDPAAVARAAEERARRAIADMEAKLSEYQRVLDELRQTQSWLTYHRQMTENEDYRQLWRDRGLRDGWQDYWELGYCNDFTISCESGKWHTPTLTIPVRDGAGEVVNIRHRLISPPKPTDKYRPDRPGLQATPFIAYKQAGWDIDPILVVEGEIKSMVTFQTAYTPANTLQVVGVPGKSAYRSIIDQLQGHDVYILFDPDANKEAEELAREVGGRFISFPMKVDDAINSGALNRSSLLRLMRMGRRAK